MNSFSILEYLIQKGQSPTASSPARRLLSVTLPVFIPFNRPHGFRITELRELHCQVYIPASRKNYNHLKGIHACALATGAELASGLSLLTLFQASHYRLIMAHLSVHYFLQARSDCLATASVTRNQSLAESQAQLADQGKTQMTVGVTVEDSSGQIVSEAEISWQLKKWHEVRTPT